MSRIYRKSFKELFSVVTVRRHFFPCSLGRVVWAILTSGCMGHVIDTCFLFQWTMPTFKKKPAGEGRGEWSVEDMKLAVQDVLENKISVRASAERHNVPRNTLQRKIRSVETESQVEMKPQLGRFKPTFDNLYENELVKHMKELDARLMPLSRNEFLKLAYDLAESLKLPHRFNREKRMAGKDFFTGFMKRHSELSYRKPQSTSLMRSVGFNKPQVERFFKQLMKLQDERCFRPSRIFNADETGVTCVHENEMVISTKGKRQVGKMTSGERGRTVTLMFCMSVTGLFIPPLFVFPRKRMNDRLMIGAPSESISFPTPTGWINGPAFLTWLKHFVSFTKPTTEDPVLLIIDGHGSHKELDVIMYARENNVHMLSVPPHTTHKLQPLDRTFMKPFKGAYQVACSLWMRANPGLRINDYDIAKLVADAYRKVCRLDIAENGFKCTGIYPLNSQIFTDLDFMGSELTNVTNSPSKSRVAVQQSGETSTGTSSMPDNSAAAVPVPTSTEPSPGTSGMSVISTASIAVQQSAETSPGTSVMPDNSAAAVPVPTSTEPSPGTSEMPDNSAPTIAVLPIPGPSLKTHSNIIVSSPVVRHSNFENILKKVSPLPSCSERRLTSRKRKAGKSEILTSTPVKNALSEKKKIGKEREEAKTYRRQLKFEKQQSEKEKGKKIKIQWP